MLGDVAVFLSLSLPPLLFLGLCCEDYYFSKTHEMTRLYLLQCLPPRHPHPYSRRRPPLRTFCICICSSLPRLTAKIWWSFANPTSLPNPPLTQHAPVRFLARFCSQVREVTVIKKAKVPLVKFVHASTGIQVDVCFEQPSGLQSGNAAKALMRQMQPVRSRISGTRGIIVFNLITGRKIRFLSSSSDAICKASECTRAVCVCCRLAMRSGTIMVPIRRTSKTPIYTDRQFYVEIQDAANALMRQMRPR